MRKLSVTEYLIAQNQAQSTVTTYARFGDAINEAMSYQGNAQSPIIDSLDMVEPAYYVEGAAHIDTYHLRYINEDDFAQVNAWLRNDGTFVYTVEHVA